MARPGITYQQVASTAESLTARGEIPSIQRIRQVLGSGSHTTIHEHLKRWQRQLAESPRAALPPSLPESLLPAVESLWQAAVEQADEAYRQRRDELQARMERADGQRQAALASRDRMQEELSELQRQQEKLRRELLDRERDLRREREGRLAAESALEEARRSQTVAERQAERVLQQARDREQRLEQTLEQHRQESEGRLQYERQRHEAEEARLMRDWDRLRVELVGQRQALETAQQQAGARETALRDQLDGSQRDKSAMLSRQAVLEERLTALDEQWERARHRCQTLEQQQLDTLRRLESLRGKLKRTGARRKALERQLLEYRAASRFVAHRNP
ncbi:MAG: DNA-binding protein [Candidatus Competibacteraceae bacterium]|nr:DNA-binding protein [Candidatus Competibacteraceae bacterium]